MSMSLKIAAKIVVSVGAVCLGANVFAQAIEARAGSVVAVSPVIMPAVQSGNTILYDQSDAAIPPLGASSQQLFSAPGNLDTQSADDIVISDALGWSVSQVNFVIATDNGKIPPAQSATVRIVADGKGFPNDNALLCQVNNTVPSFNAAGNVMSVVFASGCQLPAGHYWIEMQAVSNFNVNGNFVWEARSKQANSPAAWRNPGSGFPGGPACPNWSNFDTCQIAANSVGHVVAPDLLFQVLGTRAVVEAPPTLPTLSPWSILLLAGILAALAMLPRYRTPR